MKNQAATLPTLELANQQALLVGLSGGLDSTVLLHQLCQMRGQKRLSLRAIYVHHGLSQQADRWLQHCQQLCQQWQVPFICRYVQLQGAEQGIEAEARNLRYAAFRQEIDPQEALVTAHHQDDQCETLLLALKRGSGPTGLAAMPFCRQNDHYLHLRPLLNVSRLQLEQYATQYDLTWVEDDSNQETRFDRNFLRLQVLPQLMQRWPQFSRMVARSAELCGEQEQLLDELLATDLARAIDGARSLDIDYLATLSPLRRNALLRRWLISCQAPLPSRQALQRIWHEVALSRIDAVAQLALGSGVIRRFQQRLYWGRSYQGQRGTVLFWPDLSVGLTLPDHLGQLSMQLAASSILAIRAPDPNQRVSIQFEHRGKLHLTDRVAGRTLKKIWQERGIPFWLRDNLPLLFYDQQLICAAGIFVTCEGRATAKAGYQLLWRENGSELKRWCLL